MLLEVYRLKRSAAQDHSRRGMSEELWDIIPSIDCVDEHLQDSFDFYSVRVPGIGRRVQHLHQCPVSPAGGLVSDYRRRADLSKLVWSVTRGAVSQKRRSCGATSCEGISQT